MPPAFRIESADRDQLYVPLPVDATRDHDFLRVIARLGRDVSRAQAQADLDEVSRRLASLYPRSQTVGVRVVPLVDAMAGPSRRALLILLAVVMLVLLIACTNVASLLLARGATRHRELAVRAALGAGRGRLARQLLVESLVLSIVGGAAGLLVADWLARMFVAIVGNVVAVPRLDAARTDVWVLAFTTIVSLATGVVFGVVPALVSASPDLTDALRDAGRTSTGARAPRVRRGLVILETALALVLLAGAGVLTKTLLTMQATPPGFDAQNLLAVDLYLPPTRFSTVASRAPFFKEALARVRALPGVRAAAFVADLPLSGANDHESFHIPGRPDPAPNRWFNAGFNIASAHYFKTLGIRIREGRDFEDTDGPGSPGVIVINQTAARQFWPDRSPLGQQIDLPITREKSELLTVVGVADDVRHVGLAILPRPEIFVNSMQTGLNWAPVVLAVRAVSNPAGLADAVRAAVRDANPGVVVSQVSTGDDVVARSMAQPRLYTLLLGAFAVAAVMLAAVGLYGLIAFSAAQRSHEMGIRVALGASRSEILRLVLREGVGLAVLGTALGVAGGLAATRALVGLVAGIEPNDPATFAIVTLVLLACATLASYVPARRAATVDPLAALRAE
jgi:putative ABC transport system permease protein